VVVEDGNDAGTAESRKRKQRRAMTVGVEEKGDDGKVRGIVLEQLPLLAFSVENDNTMAAPSRARRSERRIQATASLRISRRFFSDETEAFSVCSLLCGRGKERDGGAEERGGNNDVDR
jgi:hypothetical protein